MKNSLFKSFDYETGSFSFGGDGLPKKVSIILGMSLDMNKTIPHRESDLKELVAEYQINGSLLWPPQP